MNSSLPPLPNNWEHILHRVNIEVNSLPYKSDAERYEKKEFWDLINETGGDCEDYALAKLHRLLALGFPIESLRLATCSYGWTNKFRERHAVLVVTCPGEYYILDNRFQTPVTTASLLSVGYMLEGIQEIGGSQKWVEWKNE